MGAQSQIFNTTADDLKIFQSYITGNSVAGLRAELDIINRRLVTLNLRLVELMNNESIVKARILNNVDMLVIESHLTADSAKELVQSFVNNPSTPLPDQNYGYDKYKLTNILVGIKALDAELNKINYEVQATQQQINLYSKERDIITAQMDAAEQKKPNAFIDKTFGRVLPPKKEDLEKDRIAKSRTANMLVLYRLCLSYKNYSTNPKTGAPGYPDEPKLARNLVVIQQTFAAIAKGFPNNEFLSGDTVLNLDDPGAGNNAKILLRKLGAERAVATNDKMGAEAKKFVDDLTALSQDTFSSEGIQKKPSPTLSATNSMRAQTASYPASVLKYNGLYTFSFEIPSIVDAVSNIWKRQNKNLFQDLPLCPNSPRLSPATTDEKLLEQRKQQTATQVKAVEGYQKSSADAQAVQDKIDYSSVVGLPEGAPPWVVTYKTLYGDAEKGDITTEEIDYLRGGTRMINYRAWATWATSIIDAEDKMIATVNKDLDKFLTPTTFDMRFPEGEQRYEYQAKNKWYYFAREEKL